MTPNVRVNRHFAVGRVWARLLEPKLGLPQSVRLNDKLGIAICTVRGELVNENITFAKVYRTV